MCDTILSCAKDHLVPLARDHLLPILKEAANMIRGVPKEIEEMKDELERILEFINKEDKLVDSIKGINMRDVDEKNNKIRGIQTRIKQLIEASFHIEDVIDDYMICEEQTPGCAAGANLVKTMILRLQIAYKIHNIQSQITEITDSSQKDGSGFQIQSSLVEGSTSSVSLTQNLREAPFHMEEDDVVGFDEPRDILVDWLVKGEAKRTVVSVVAMGGQGKTTLAKKVFDNNKIVKHFDCRVWITVSQPYDIEKLLRDLLQKLYKQQQENPPESIHQMKRGSLINEVENYLKEKRYVVVFDDVWDSFFWADIEYAMIDNKKGSRILITTRKMDVAIACRTSSFVEIHELKELNEKQSLELFNKKAFYDLNGCCPENLVDISSEIVKKCYGLPLAIVVTGGLLSLKNRHTYDWCKFSENINLELNKVSTIKQILGLSYHDLPYNLKSCLLYFGLYLEDSTIPSNMLIQQWMAEGFVKEVGGKTMEEVAEGYLTELIHRSLVQVHSISIDGRKRRCQVHDLVHAIILEKCNDLSFCKNIFEDKQSSLNAMVRRLSIETSCDYLKESTETSQVQSLYCYNTPESFVRRIPTKFSRLKVLLLVNDGLLEIPKDLGSLSHLKYFMFWGTSQERKFSLPKSIDRLKNLETLDLRDTNFNAMPKEICKLRKLRNFRGIKMSLIQLKDDIGGMTSLQTLREVCLDEDEDDDEDKNDMRVVKLIQELGKLIQLRELVLVGAKSKYMSILSSSINKMQKLEKLRIKAEGGNIVMHLNSPPPMLRDLSLDGKFDRLEWISKLHNLAKLKVQFMDSKQADDVMKLLKDMPNLLSLRISGSLWEREFQSLHFQDGWFKYLKELYLSSMNNLSYFLIDKGALISLKKLQLCYVPKLKTLPMGIQHLEKLEFLYLWSMSKELVQSIAPHEGKQHSIFKQVPSVDIRTLN